MIGLEPSEAKDNPFSLIEDGHLSIKTKAGELIPFKLNRAQKHILGIIKTLWNENKIIRLWILKARQLGISTLIEAIIYSITSQKENTNSLIVADDDDGSSYVFEISKLYHEKCPSHLRAKEKKSNEKKLEFDGIHSQILIDTARNKNAGRNYTFQLAHLSNYAYFPYPDDIMSGLNNSVPALPRTMIIKETTAKGFNFACEEWRQAKAGEIDYTPIFIPWYWDDGYKMEAEHFVIGDTLLGDVTKDEPSLYDVIKAEGIDDIEERLAWRRWKIKNDCKGSVFAFNQEFPSNDREAFEEIVGRPRFDPPNLKAMFYKARKPIRGNLEYDGSQVYFVENKSGIVEVYRFPDDKTVGAIGVDVATGIEGDSSVASFVNFEELSEDIVIESNKLDPSQFAAQVWCLGHWCNEALIAVENNGPGLACILPLKNDGEVREYRKGYRKLYYKDEFDEATKKKTRKIGWCTSNKTKPIMIDKLAELIREGSIDIPSEDTIRQLQTYIIEEDGKMNAAPGCHDDRTMALAIACMMYFLRPKIDLNQKFDIHSTEIAHYPNRR